MTAVEHSPVNRAGEGDQSQAVPRTSAHAVEEIRGLLGAADNLAALYEPDEEGATPEIDTEAVRAVLALVRPVEGMVLTPEEAQLAATALRSHARDLEPMSRYRARIAEELIDSNILAERLEASA